MARIETWFNQDLKEAVKVRYIDGNVFSADNKGNIVGVNVFDNGAAASLSGSVSANVIRADGATVAVSGTLSSNKAYVVLPQSAYVVPGVISIIIKLTSGTDITTLCAVVANVYAASTDSIVDPGTIIPSVQTLIEEIETAVASIPADYSSLWTSLAPAYSTSSAYAVGEYVTYNGGLYRCKTAIASGESWTSSHWVETKLGPDIYTLKNDTKKLSVLSDGVLGVQLTLNKYINTSGVIQNGSGGERLATEEYISIIPGDTITYRLESGHASVNAISFYDYKKVYVSGVSNTGTNGTTLTVTVPANCVYARFSTRTNIDTFVHFSSSTIENVLGTTVRTLGRVNTNGIYFTENYRIDVNGKLLITSASGERFATMDYIPVAAGAKITYQLETDHSDISAVAFYDKDKVFISGITNTGKAGSRMDSVVPANCKYVRFSTRSNIETYVSISPVYNIQNNAAYISSEEVNIPQSIEGLRRNLPTEKSIVQLPSLSYMSNYGINVYTDGYSYECLSTLERFKNTSSNVYFVKNSTEFATAVSGASAGDTIYLGDGVYESTPFTYSLNIIAQNKGKVWFVKRSLGDTETTATDGVYKFSVSTEPTAAYYKPEGENATPIKLTKNNSTGTTISNPGSFNYDSDYSYMYIHLPDDAYPTKYNVFIDVANSTTISIRSNSNNIKFYIDGVNVWGNGYGLYADSGNGGTIDVIAVDCCFWHSNSSNVISLLGANGYFQRCEVAYGYRDGINYHANGNNVVACGLEIDCICHDNGAEADPQTEESNNGSTTHDGGKCIRINGYYYRNYGGNIAETNSGTVSYNYGCVAFDSRASSHHPTWNGDFWCGDSATQYAYGCRCLGDSTYGLDNIAGTVIYYDKYTETGTTYGNVVEI